MTKPKFPDSPSAAASSPSASPPVSIIVDGDVGGVGKSTLAIMMATAFHLVEQPLDIFELDEQGKLGRFIGNHVVALHGAKMEADADGDRDVVPIFQPLHTALVDMHHTRRSLVLEVGGALTSVWNSFIKEVDLDEDLVALGIPMAVFLLAVASEESIRQVTAQAATLRRILPSASIVIVMNERDGSVMLAAEEMPEPLRGRFQKVLSLYPHIIVPRLPVKSRRIYERLGLSPIEIVGWQADHYREASAQTGKSLLEAKRFVKDVGAWAEAVRVGLARVLPFLEGR
ncbi:hypothetical protein [Hansschlegelia sp. KR7-227]|uniref:hypothetical protein n=1 Tax=Hansschlegelia sp. KR7-227 TaxID=3400914 RepID=UPI003C0CFDF9